MPSSWLYLTIGITAALTILGALAIIIAQGELATGKRTVTVTGEVVCLPHKKVFFGLFNQAETQECLIGFLEKEGGQHYFGLEFQNEKHSWIRAAEGSKELYNVTGTITIPPTNTVDYGRYDVVGLINVTSASTADGSTSIYEVRSRYFNQLTAILDEIYSKTGAGYSWGIDKCDNDEPCIKIGLDKEVPSELLQKIPKQLEGFRVDVQTRQE